ncbi:MAG: phosphate/phosphite/phosphonate ABC transporter substrate-binding protein [Deltaproteobacteria bacterium]|nr:phosphate/phosphite/phosphonate ABC transporter substrate-binding protein [Deltaproteobacteria bacterium]
MKIIKVLLLTVILFPLFSIQSFSETKPLRIGITAVLIEQNININHRIGKYIGDRLNVPVETVYRRGYGDIIQMLGRSEIDIAFICGYAYVEGKDKFDLELVVSPTLNGKPFYRSYVIVPSTSEDKDFFDLRGKRYAFTDPLSNSGYLVPLFWLAQKGESPDRFFKKIIYTRTHYNSIEAVAMRIVSGASVDSYIWEHAREIAPELVSKTIVVKESELFPFPPVVARKSLEKNIKAKVREVLMSMSKDPVGSLILAEIGLDGFIAVTDDFYNPIRIMGQRVKGLAMFSREGK